MKYILSLCVCLFVLNSFSQTSFKKVKETLILKDPPFKECHASTIIALQPNNLLAAWFGGTDEGNRDVCIWLSKYNDGQWGPPRQMACGIMNDTLRYPCWNPVLFKTQKGTLYLFYKIGPNPREWWGMQIHSTDDGNTWSSPAKLGEGIIGPVKNKPLQLGDGTILAGSSVEISEDKWHAHIEKSVDDGNSWQKIAVDSNSKFDVIQPSILYYKDGRLQMLCRSRQGSIIQSWSSNNGNSWSALSKTNLPNPNSGTDAITLADGRQLLVYNPDKPGKEWNNGRAKLAVAISSNGINWKNILWLEYGTIEEFSYPAVVQDSEGNVHITYTYDRKNVKYVLLQKQISKVIGK
jgi:predicted neuraminidase